MTTKDNMKLLGSGWFEIFALHKMSDNKYILKQFNQDITPLWNIISEGQSYNETLEIFHKNKHHDRYPILVQDTISMNDLKEICQKGFNIYRENKVDFYHSGIELFDADSSKWNCICTFDDMFARMQYINKLESDSRNIMV